MALGEHRFQCTWTSRVAGKQIRTANSLIQRRISIFKLLARNGEDHQWFDTRMQTLAQKGNQLNMHTGGRSRREDRLVEGPRRAFVRKLTAHTP